MSTTKSLRVATVLGLGLFVFQGFTSFYPLYLVEVKGLSAGVTTVLYGLLFSFAVLIQPVSGALGDLFDARKLLIGALAMETLGLLLFPFAEGVLEITGITLLLGSWFVVSPIAIPVLTNSLPADIKGAGLGLIRSGYFIVGSLGSVFMGVLIEQGLFDESFAILAIPTILALVAIASLTDLNRQGNAKTG